MPVLRVEAIARRLGAGAQLLVFTDDPLARVDIPHAMRQAGHSCAESPETDEKVCVFEVTLAG